MAAVLADFQSWLTDLAAPADDDEQAGGTPALRSAGVPPAQHRGETIDLHTLLGQFLAVRQEVNLQTRAVRAQQEQNAETLRQLAAALDALHQNQVRAEQSQRQAEEEAVRPLLKTLIDLYDALAIAGREIERMGEMVQPSGEQPAANDEAPRSFFRFFRRKRERDREWEGERERVRQMLASLRTGYTMSLQRVERALRQHGLEAIPTAGQRFDPERMEVVEAVAGSGRPAGEVIDEIRRGYTGGKGMEPIVGIDLGTTNSEVALVRDGQPVVFAENDDPILPSFVGLSEDGRLLVGRAAKNQWVLAPERTIKSIKRKMGQDVKVQLGDQEYRPQEISAMILKALRDRAAARLGAAVNKAVITVPAYFNDAQRQATREAGELAGLEVVRILNEPTAASLTYDPGRRELRRLLVYDLGGGTFDVSIVQAQEGVVEVLASHGDTQLGGDDFDDLLLNLVCDRFEQEHGVDLRADLVSRSRVLRAVEAAKCQLSYHPLARIEEEFIAEKEGRALHLDMELTRDEYETLIGPLLDRTMDCVRRALDDANLSAAAIDKVVLVGGSTRTPLVGRLLEERLGQPAHQEVNPDLCVAMGAAIQAAIIAGADVGAVLVDITPHSLGIKCVDSQRGFPFEYHFAPIIHRNTALPASRSELFYTFHDNQTEVEIDVYQGESDDVRRNHRVGRFMVQGLSRVPSGNPIVVQLDLNLDGILKVSARERATGLHKQVVIENALARFERDELGPARERLEQLWALPGGEDGYDDEDELSNGFGEVVEDELPSLVPGPRQGQREAVQARALLEKAERLLERTQPEDRAEVERLMANVRNALADRHWDKVTAACNELADTLFYLEDI